MCDENWTTYAELDALRSWAKGARTCVEVGTWKGRSAEAILEGSVDGVLYCVDSFIGDPAEHVRRTFFDVPIEQVKRAWEERLSRFGERVTLVEMESADAAEYLGQWEFDFVFIDACHSYEYVKRDLHLWAPLVRKGGLICGHDFNQTGVRDAVKEYFGDRFNIGPEKLWRVRL